MRRDEAEKILAAFIFGDLDEASKADVTAYLQEDDELRERLADMRMAVKVASDTLGHGPDPVLSDRRMKRLQKLARRRSNRRVVFSVRRLAIAAAILIGVWLPAFLILNGLDKAAPSSGRDRAFSLSPYDASESYVANAEKSSEGGEGIALGGGRGFAYQDCSKNRRESEILDNFSGNSVKYNDGHPVVEAPVDTGRAHEPGRNSRRDIEFTGGTSTTVDIGGERFAKEVKIAGGAYIPTSPEKTAPAEGWGYNYGVKDGDKFVTRRSLSGVKAMADEASKRPAPAEVRVRTKPELPRTPVAVSEPATDPAPMPVKEAGSVTRDVRSEGEADDAIAVNPNELPAIKLKPIDANADIAGNGVQDAVNAMRDGDVVALLPDVRGGGLTLDSGAVSISGEDVTNMLHLGKEYESEEADKSQAYFFRAKDVGGTTHDSIFDPTKTRFEATIEIPDDSGSFLVMDLSKVSNADALPLPGVPSSVEPGPIGGDVRGLLEEESLGKQLQEVASSEFKKVFQDKKRFGSKAYVTHGGNSGAAGPAGRVAKDEIDLPPASRFKTVPVNPWVIAERDSLSTFGLDVDTASYAVCRRYIRGGFLPPIGAVRMEEFVNYFNYNYPQRTDPTFTVHTEAAPSPFAGKGKNLTLLKIGVKARTIGRDQQKAAHLIVVVDASASMGQPDRLPYVQQALNLLIGRLSAADRVTLITCSDEARLHLESVSAKEAEKIRQAVNSIQPSGTTNLLSGLKLGYAAARRAFSPNQVNHVVLCSDGVANVGQTEADAVLKAVAQDRKQGITITCVGVGYGSYNDTFLEALANRGDGSYVFLDSARQAQRVFVEQLSATLHNVAKDARIQVKFNPSRVRRYRLIGYENRDIEDNRFRDDTVDAGEVGSGQCSTALYEVELTGQVSADRQGDLGTVFVRYRNSDTNKIEEISSRIGSAVVQRRTVEKSPRFYLAACAARFAEILRESEHARDANLKEVMGVIEKVGLALPLDRDVTELVQLIRASEHLPRSP